MKQDVALKILCSGENVFLTGSAGTGKTFVINKYIKYLKERRIEPAIVAPTGIAASHIGGKTIHSFFSIGIKEYIDDGYINWLTRQRFLGGRLRDLKVLIVDEISMVSPELFSSMDRILRAFKKSNEPFGGVQVILSGDFFQLPPISKERKEIKFVWQTNLWQNMGLKICYLEEKFRQDDEVLINILEEIRSGEVSEDSMDVFRSRYKKKLANNFNPTKLYTHNADVDKINEIELENLSGKSITFSATTKGSKKNIEKIFKSSLVAEEVKLKKEAIVIFIKNNYEKGYINGTLGKVVSFTEVGNHPIVEIFSGRKIVAEKDEWLLEDDKGDIKARVRQTPLRLAWALTIHKSQGMTLDAAEIDLSKTFEIGQGYVALSRIKSIQGLRLMGLNDIALKVDELVLEIDCEMKEISRLNSIEFRNLNEKELIETHQNFIVKCGGTIEEREIEENKKGIKKMAKDEKKSFKSEQPRGGTIEITKKMLRDKKTIAQIAKERGLAESTILSHLQEIKKLLPELDIEHLKPKAEILCLVLGKAKEIKNKKNPDDFSQDGQIRLRPIFEGLNEKISYEEIKLAMLFWKE
ncbi:MAG: hypothetical protein UR66_C0001G0101 [Candidatus Moranbacteria bacterium GW2011_GWE1_35_17]|nr:MAG: hypothetical protein UR66_C0001G0101 [Candidatus Moranbacteria bacterium GW2011_GWE1_35_17]KKP73117.1 MAG: hypothetical protein UR65_C0007G0003 [Candidatus Moranbacteria bacterium GW2011_GWE2_35_164]KKP85179.1 MAG: hypothetical protein UR83_C0003G0014 [Candidatus Moranbacteria bacterium GW2011_GWF2_35_54]OGS62817.1 MAG: hypothetical protein A2X07_10845 [Flavobacteria bacterium GWF1_32_7]